MFPLLTSPRGFIRGVPEDPTLMGPDKSAMRSDFLEGGRGVDGEAGMEIPTTVDVGRPFTGLGRDWLPAEVDEVATGRRRDAHDFLRGGGTGAGCAAVAAAAALDFDERAGEGGVGLSSPAGNSDDSLL
jgi:hypothetical protein